MLRLPYKMLAVFFTLANYGSGVRDHDDVDTVDEHQTLFNVSHLFEEKLGGMFQNKSDADSFFSQDPTQVDVQLDLQIDNDKTANVPQLQVVPMSNPPLVIPSTNPYRVAISYSPSLYSTYGIPNMVVREGKAYYEVTITNDTRHYSHFNHETNKWENVYCSPIRSEDEPDVVQGRTRGEITGAQLGWAEDGILSAEDGWGGRKDLPHAYKGVGDDGGGWSYGFCPFRLDHFGGKIATEENYVDHENLNRTVRVYRDTLMNQAKVGSIIGVAVDWDNTKISFGLTNKGEKTIWEVAFDFIHCAKEHAGVFPAFTGNCFDMELDLNPQEPSRSPGGDFKPFAQIAKKVTPATDKAATRRCIANRVDI